MYLCLSPHIQSSCNINIRTTNGLTPLHIAAHEGHTAIVEVLVGYGADLNAADEERGNAPLHLIIARKNMKPIDASMAYLWKVMDMKWISPLLHCYLLHFFILF